MAGKVSVSRWAAFIPFFALMLGGAFIILLSHTPNSLTLASLTLASLHSHEFSKESLEYDPMSKLNWTDVELLQAAAEASPRTGKERIAFLFIVRGDIPHEPIWRRFFRGHETEHSLYVHANPGHRYSNGSLFAGHEIPSQECPRFSRNIVDALRRLYAHALLDPRYNNAWFVNVCESSLPIRSFAFAYEYLTKSPVSFVESFHPVERHHLVATPAALGSMTSLRKGELWMALRREHARVVVLDREVYDAFEESCKVFPSAMKFCTWDEQYVQTLLALRDSAGIANRTVMYVDWTGVHVGSPRMLQAGVDVVKDLQGRAWDTDGERHDTAFDNATHACVWGGVSPWPCFLFARKFAAAATAQFMAMETEVLGY